MRPTATPRSAAGFSIVELMVAMVIALIGTIIIFQVFEASEGIKRSTTSGGDAQHNGLLALYALENDLRNAGMGFNDTAYAGCTVRAYDARRATPNFTLTLAPVMITAGATERDPDRITVFYGSQHLVGGSTTLAVDMTTDTGPIRVSSRYGYRAGDLMILLQPGVAKDCSLMEVTALPSLPSNEIRFGTSDYPLVWSANELVAVRFNHSDGHDVVYTGAGTAGATRVFNLGNRFNKDGDESQSGPSMPVHNTYAIVGNNLTATSLFAPDSPVTVADNVVHMRAFYALDDGVDNRTVRYHSDFTAGDGKVDRYLDAATFDGLSPKPWRYLIGVKLVLVARAALMEKASDGGEACDTTTSDSQMLTWSGSVWAADGEFPADPPMSVGFDLSGDENWQCYRYKTFETMIPLRNWIWKSDS